MSNVWTAIVHRAPCVARQHGSSPLQHRSSPLLHLFNGYARSIHSQPCRWRATRNQDTRKPLRTEPVRRDISTTSCLAAQKGKGRSLSTPKAGSRKPPPPLTKSSIPKATPKGPTVAEASDTKLEPPTTVASHTEGLPPEEEQLTWRDYDPLGGMPLPNGERTQPEINAVFNSEEIDVDTGNYILCVMHWRRESGALIDVGLDFPKDTGVSKETALKGLQYVRSIAPDVDEAANGSIWASEESERLQAEIQERAVKLGLYKARDDQDEEYEEQPVVAQEGDRTSTSVLQARRQENEARHKKEEAEMEAAKVQAEAAALNSARGPLELSAGVQPGAKSEKLQVIRTSSGKIEVRKPPQLAFLKPVERKPWVKYYEDQATIIKEKTVPNLSQTRRLGPPLLVVLLVLAGCYYLSENYTPPPKSARMWPDTPPSVATLYAITSILCASFILGRMPPLWRTYSKYMTTVPAYPFAISMVGQIFRHDTIAHLASNLVTLWLFGLLLHEDVGRGTFLAIFFASGALGSYTSLAFNVLRKDWASWVYGSSGAILGVFAAACAVRPNGTIRVFGYDVPIAAWFFLAVFGTAEALALVMGVKTKIDHAGHLGGIVSGVAMAMYLRQTRSKGQAGDGKSAGVGEGDVVERVREEVLEETVSG